MRRVSVQLRLLLSPLGGLLEPARDLVARAQTACESEQRGAMLRAFVELHSLCVPPLDALIEQRGTALRSADPSEQEPVGRSPDVASSACLGLLGLWDELLDVDIERENLLELLALHSANSESPSEPACPEGLATTEVNIVAQRAWLERVLSGRDLPQRQWWRRLTRRARGPLGNRARLTVERQALRVVEHLPELDAPPTQDATTFVGELRAGDRLSLAVQVPLPGQLAVLHASGSAQIARLDMVLPETVSEEVVRRQHEIVELSGELATERNPDSSIAEQSLVVVWVPEVMPPSWMVDMLLRQGVPPEARVWRYLYRVID